MVGFVFIELCIGKYLVSVIVKKGYWTSRVRNDLMKNI